MQESWMYKTIYRNAGPDSVHHWHAGHINPAAHGGSNNVNRNCVPLCDECNYAIGANQFKHNKR